MAIPTGAPFSKYIDENILTPLMSRLDFILTQLQLSEESEPTDDDDDEFSEIITACMGDLQEQFGKIGKKELPLAEFFDPVEKHIDSIFKDIDAGKRPKRSEVRRLQALKLRVAGIRDAIVEPYKKTEEGSASRSRGGGGGDDPPALAATDRNRIGGVARDGEEMAHLRRAVDGMDEPLKSCLLSLAAFPEGAVIRRRLLVHWWIGEQLVEDAAKGNDRFSDLVAMKFIRATARECSAKASLCTVHPWIHRVVVAVANSSAFMAVDPPDDIPGNDFRRTRRACLRNGKTAATGTLPPASRSELGFHPEVLSIYNIDQRYVKLSAGCLANKTSLRTLQLGQWRVFDETKKAADAKRFHVELVHHEHLNGIGACRNLRYLSLRGISRIDAIPDAVGKLRELVVLDLRACYNLQKLSKEVTKLRKLQYLDVSDCYLLIEMPQGLKEMTCLQVLKGFVVASLSARKDACRLSELVRLEKLRKLSICIGKKTMQGRQDELEKLAELSNLTSLRITWAVLASRSNPDGGAISFSLPPNLQKLDLQCFPSKKFSQLIRASTQGLLSNLRKLYVTGGLLESLDLEPLCDPRNLEVLRLRFLKHLQEGDYEQLRAKYSRLKITRDPGSAPQNALSTEDNHRTNEASVSSQMDRSWMYLDSRMCKEYIKGVSAFKSAAEEHMRKSKNDSMYCPCIDCGNKKMKKSSQVHAHLLLRGFTKGYTRWTKHGEDHRSHPG